ncbi:MAG: hypothetical protein F6K19_26990 [Cyanothece sp. SIO1E1]|nr:hypothetical protein [Cyanothece sp. SIO1E1]
MKRTMLLTTAVGLLAITPLAIAQTFQINTGPPTPVDTNNSEVIDNSEVSDTPVIDDLDERFSRDYALVRLEQIQAALTSFRGLTEVSQTSLSDKAIAEVGNTDWESQNLGFHNWIGSVEGTLRWQDLQIKQLEFSLAEKRFQDGDIPQAMVAEKSAVYEAAIADYQEFLNSFQVVD